MSTLKGRIAAAASVLAVTASVLTISLTGGGAADATVTGQTTTQTAAAAKPCPVPKTACYPIAANALASLQAVDNSLESRDIKNGTLLKDDMSAALYAVLFDVPANGVNNTSKIKDGVITLPDLDAALQALVTKTGPAYDKNWGEIFRNTIKSGHAELGSSSAGEALNITTPSAADAAAFGNEADFADKPVALTAVKYEVFTTGENAALAPNNMPALKFEMDPDVDNAGTAVNYTTLVYAPDNSASNAWTAIDAKADTGNHWGFTGSYFNADPARCGLNGTRCTLTEALAVLGADAKFISAGVGKGRDFEFHGAVRSLTINATTYKFTAGGVLKN